MNRQIRLLAQADLLLLLADLFRAPENIQRPLGDLRMDCLSLLIDTSGLAERDQLIAQLQTAVKVACNANREEWEACYRLLFDGSMICPINEAGFIRRDKGSIIGDVCGFYNAFGWTTTEQSGERPDHLLAELEFTAMLLVMAARAETSEQSELAEAALGEFARHHLNDWMPAFCEQLLQSTSYPVLVEAAELTKIVWPALQQWHEWPVDPAPVSTVGIAKEPENPYECGAPDLVTLEPA